MKGLGSFQAAQAKRRDARVISLCQHLRSAIDILEQIASDPCRQPENLSPEPVVVARVEPPSFPSQKLAYTIKEATAALGISRSTLYKAMAKGELAAMKLGSRTLIGADAIRHWMTALPGARR